LVVVRQGGLFIEDKKCAARRIFLLLEAGRKPSGGQRRMPFQHHPLGSGFADDAAGVAGAFSALVAGAQAGAQLAQVTDIVFVNRFADLAVGDIFADADVHGCLHFLLLDCKKS
jgi:hypothetical protein